MKRGSVLAARAGSLALELDSLVSSLVCTVLAVRRTSLGLQGLHRVCAERYIIFAAMFFFLNVF